MYIAFIYDHEYVKSDQDFYGDAIISFYPAEYKEKVKNNVCLKLLKKVFLFYILLASRFVKHVWINDLIFQIKKYLFNSISIYLVK